ncbi:DUF6538 domain-containing protein [Rhizobium sp. BT04]|uniref:DUF6538 domain-containing protein n=1 Tax=Rhizobium sp. BT04 TaxID=3045157 RepID=UPI0024B3D887|nr:DUF6538 domain-containing protein [Rhizobium sp. BT04]
MPKGPRKKPNHADRFLTPRGGIFYYKRRVPASVMGLDERGEHVRISLGTDDRGKARAMRDIYEKADDDLWASLTLGEGSAIERYHNTVKTAQALGFNYRPAAEVANESLANILARIDALKEQAPVPVIEAGLGGVEHPEVTVTEAFRIYCDEIAAHEIATKSKGQKARWLSGKQGAVDNFVEVVGDLVMTEISRADGHTYHQYWRKRIAPGKGEGPATHTPSHGNRRIGNMRVLFDAYFKYLGEPDRPNPFDGLSYREKKSNKRKRPPFPPAWITDTILKVGALAGLNDEARGIALVVAQLGTRPSEICNLSPEFIILDHEVPHLKIEPRDDPEDPREIKTDSSIRIVPLIGMALDVMRKFPNGFPRYKDKENSLSAALNKYFKENGLCPTDKHSIYSFRHSFEDRMKNTRVDAELRKILMGHALDRPEYGEGGSLRLRLEEISKTLLPYDPSIV